MTTEYIDGTEIKRVAEKEVLPRWHDHLRKPHILYLFQDKLPPNKGRAVMAKIRKATATERFIGQYHLVLVVSEMVWRAIDENKRIALLDHEFCHVQYDDDKMTYRLVGHDLEEFRDVVRRHGAWFADIEMFNEAVAESQGELPYSQPNGNGA